MSDDRRTRVPAEVVALADARALARAGRDWAEADRLRAQIEAGGWRVTDRGFSYSLAPAHAPDIQDGTGVRYGRSASVPSRLEDPPGAVATIVLIATDIPGDVGRTLAALAAHAPVGTQVVVVGDGPGPDQDAALDELLATGPSVGGRAVEVVRTSERLGHAEAANAGIRRADGRIVILLAAGSEPTGDVVTPLVDALDHPNVAVAGGWGSVTSDLRRLDDAPPGDVDVVDGCCQAFRRDDYAALGPLDERFRHHRGLDTWWSLVLRDAGEGTPPRRAVRVADLPLVRREHVDDASVAPAERDRQVRRNAYRILDRFGRRTDLLHAGEVGQDAGA